MDNQSRSYRDNNKERLAVFLVDFLEYLKKEVEEQRLRPMTVEERILDKAYHG